MRTAGTGPEPIDRGASASPPRPGPTATKPAGDEPGPARAPRWSVPLCLAALVAACLVPALLALGALVDVDLRAQDAALHRTIVWLSAIAVVALALALWIAVRISRVVTQSVASLVEPALALGSGRPVEPPPTPFRETDAVARAIRQASRMLATAQHHAYHDPLTDLRNRTLFDEMASRQIAQAYRDGAQLAILAIDLDGFKAVNDQHGHAAGDLVLQRVAGRITGTIRGSDVVSRRGGDEFSVLLVDVDGARTRRIAEKLLAALSQPYPDVAPPVSASIGVARYPHDATTLDDLLERADEALYVAKNAGKRRVVGDF